MPWQKKGLRYEPITHGEMIGWPTCLFNHVPVCLGALQLCTPCAKAILRQLKHNECKDTEDKFLSNNMLA